MNLLYNTTYCSLFSKDDNDGNGNRKKRIYNITALLTRLLWMQLTNGVYQSIFNVVVNLQRHNVVIKM